MKFLYTTTNIHKLRGANRALAGTGIELMPPSDDKIPCVIALPCSSDGLRAIY